MNALKATKMYAKRGRFYIMRNFHSNIKCGTCDFERAFEGC